MRAKAGLRALRCANAARYKSCNLTFNMITDRWKHRHATKHWKARNEIMASEYELQNLAKRVFYLTMAGVVAQVSVIFLFIF